MQRAAGFQLEQKQAGHGTYTGLEEWPGPCKSLPSPFLAGLELSHCVGTDPLGPAGPWRPGGPCKMKRVRTVFKPEQLERLEQEFLKQQYMVGTERVDLAATLHLTETQVRDGAAGDDPFYYLFFIRTKTFRRTKLFAQEYELGRTNVDC